jgi:hypothetical protein
VGSLLSLTPASILLIPVLSLDGNCLPRWSPPRISPLHLVLTLISYDHLHFLPLALGVLLMLLDMTYPAASASIPYHPA